MQCDYSSYEICFQMLIYLVRMVYIFYCWLRMVHIFICFTIIAKVIHFIERSIVCHVLFVTTYRLFVTT